MSISGETSASVAITKALEEYIARRSPQGMRDLAGKLRLESDVRLQARALR